MPDAFSTRSVIFFGWSQAELESLLATIKSQIQTEGLDYVMSASGNGKSAANGQRMPLKDWLYHLRDALQELAPATYGYGGRTARAVVAPGVLFAK